MAYKAIGQVGWVFDDQTGQWVYKPEAYAVFIGQPTEYFGFP